MSEYLETLAGEMLAEGRRAFALTRAVEVSGAGTPPNEVVHTAELFERYLRGKSAELRALERTNEPK